MCAPFSPSDEIPPISPVADALEALRTAESDLFKLAALLSEDARPRDLGAEAIDTRINRIVGTVYARRYEFDRAVCSLMRGETFRPYPTESAIKVEMQNRAGRLSGGASFDLLRTAMAAVDAAPADAPMPVPARRTSFAALDAGVHSPAAAE